MHSGRVVTAAFMLAAAAAAPAGALVQADAGSVILATTTSFRDTGLLDSLAPLFERRTGMRLRVVAVGSGQALRMGERGDADVLLVHSPAAEAAFMAAGHGVARRVVATNYFTIVGPPDDPAHVRDAPSAAEALARIARQGAVFVSRGDSSGTHARELRLWSGVGGPRRWSGYYETGQGMAASLLVASERRGYTLSDRATFGSLRPRLDLVPLREREPDLLNVYHVIELDPAGHPRMNIAGGHAFAEFMLSAEVQALLDDFGRHRLGAPLFVPARGVEP